MSSTTSNSFRRDLGIFSRTTTFHGIRYIAESGSLTRKCMWIFVVLGCIGAVGYQIVDRFCHFYSLPVNVNVQINYNQTLTFPAVTICNQNAFRATAAEKFGYYRLVESMFSTAADFRPEHLQQHEVTNLTIEQLYRALRHEKEDLIVKCKWSNEDCGPDDFDLILTDHGVCYIFRGKGDDMLISSSGVDAGLRLTLNVEQYEYMTGPHDAAGVKLLLHDPREHPSVHSLGQAIPTGSHAFVGVKFMVVNNLPKPYGECIHKRLRHSAMYTTEQCYSECLVDMANITCGCRDMYMPHTYGAPPVCTISQLYGCFRDFVDNFNDGLRDECQCPVPCHFSVFDPSISYATISNHIVNKLLTSTDSASLKSRLLDASEVTSRMDEDKFETFRRLVDNLDVTYIAMKQVLHLICESASKQIQTATNVTSHMKSVFLEKEKLYRFQEYFIKQNLFRGREAMEERILRNIALGFAEFAMLAKRRIIRLVNMTDADNTEREELYNLVVDSLYVRHELAELAKANLTLLYESYINGTKIFNYKFEDIDRSHNDYIAPKPLMNYSMHYNWYVRKYAPKVVDDLDLYQLRLNQLTNETQTAYLNGEFNETRFNYIYEGFLRACRTFMFSKSVFYSQGIEYPLQVIQQRHLTFDNNWIDFNAKAETLQQNLNSLDDSLREMKEEILLKMDNVININKMYLSDKIHKLTELSEELLSEETTGNIRALRNVFQDVQTRGQDIYDLWTLLEEPMTTMWTMTIDDPDMIEYYEYSNNTRFLSNLTEVLSTWCGIYSSCRDENDVRNPVQTQDDDFLTAFDEIAEYIKGFKSSIKVDSNFLRDNFLQVDVFFRQLSYEQITQQVAYDEFALICDIGGAMGLFIGASMLTVVEVLDFLLTQTPLFSRRENSRTNKQPIS